MRLALIETIVLQSGPISSRISARLAAVSSERAISASQAESTPTGKAPTRTIRPCQAKDVGAIRSDSAMQPAGDEVHGVAGEVDADDVAGKGGCGRSPSARAGR